MTDEAQLRNLLLNVSCYSSRLKGIRIKRKNGTYLELVPSLHLYLYSKFGLQKSTIFDRIEKGFKDNKHPVISVSELTAASVVGTIDRSTGEIIFPAAYYARNGILLVDEFNLNPNQSSSIVKSFLTLLSHEKVERRISLKEKEPIMTPDIYCNNGWLRFKNLRCAVIFATMKNVKKNREAFFSGLLSRCVPISINSDVEDLIKFDDNPDLLFHKLDLEIPKGRVNFSFKEYEKIREYVKTYDILPELFLRTLNDCVRACAVLGKHDEELSDYIITSRNWYLE